MKIRVKYTAQLKKAVGKREESIELTDGALVADLLTELFQQNKQAFSNIVFNADGVFLNAVLIILNGQQISFESTESLNENDEVTIMSPIAGG